MASIERSTLVAAPAHSVWEQLADFGALASWVPMIQHSCLLSEQTADVGTVRRVQIAQQTLVERVTDWHPDHTLSYSIEGLPPIVGRAHTTWSIRPAGRVTEVSIATTIETGRNPAKGAIAKKVLERMAMAADVMLAGLRDALEPAATEPTTIREQR